MFSFLKKQNTTKRLKIIIAGDGGVGKTSFFKCLSGLDDTQYKHDRNYKATPINNFNMLTVSISTNYGEYILDIWDTAGQEFKEGDLREAFICCSDGILLFYDVNEAKTRHNLDIWIEKIRKICDPNIPAIIIGNKMDRIKSNDGRQIIIRESRLPHLKNKHSMLFSVRQRMNYNDSKKKGIFQVLDPIEELLKIYSKNSRLEIEDYNIINSNLVNNTSVTK